MNAYEFYVAGRTGPDSAGVYMLRQDNGAVIARFLVQPPDSGYYGYHISGVEYDPRDASYWVTFYSRSAPYHKIAKYSGFYPVGIGEVAGQHLSRSGPGLRCRPNPCRAEFNVEGRAPGSGLDRIELCDATGRRVKTVVLGAAGRVDVRGLAAGVYVVRMANRQGRTTSAKVVVQR